MAYAAPSDVEAILPPEEEMPPEPSNPDAPSREWLNLTTALEEATDLVIGFLEREFTDDDEDGDGVPDDVPPAVRRVVARVALRSFTDEPNQPGAESEVNLMGPFSHTVNWSKDAQTSSMWLTEGEKMRLERFKLGYTGGVAHMPMYGACGAWPTY